MDVQHLITGLIVAGASAYACWALMPRRWRAVLLRRLGRESVGNGSACGGCDSCGPAPAASADKVIRIQRR